MPTIQIDFNITYPELRVLAIIKANQLSNKYNSYIKKHKKEVFELMRVGILQADRGKSWNAFYFTLLGKEIIKHLL